MAEIPAGEYTSHIHRSIDQLRSMNERGVLSQIGIGALQAATSTDLRTTIVHDYKPYISDLRNNERIIEYSTNNNTKTTNNNLENRNNNNNNSNSNNNNSDSELRHPEDQKPHYSAPSTPPTPLSITEAQMNESKIFANKSDLQMHNQLHMRESKPYKCSQCTKSFANSSYLSQHTRIHLGIKPYRCEICQRKFTQLSHLQQHIRTHTGDKPYKCRHPGCPKAFSQLSNLQSHSRCHQTDKPYKCNSCYKCFTDETALLDHIPKHKESKHLKTHICQFCGKSYTQETYLSKHLQKHAERAEKRANRANTNAQNHVVAVAAAAAGISADTAAGLAGLAGLGLNRMSGMVGNVGSVSEHPYWPKVSPDSAVSLAEAMQQQQQQQYDFAVSQNNGEHLQAAHQRTILEHHRNGNSDEVGEDLVVIRQNPVNLNAQQHISQQQTPPASTASAVVTSSYDVKTTTNSAFTPINSVSVPTHLNTLAAHHHQQLAAQRPYLYDAISFQNQKSINQNASNAFPNQLISLHQIRNYAHQPGAAGIMAGEHILGIGVGVGKEKGQ